MLVQARKGNRWPFGDRSSLIEDRVATGSNKGTEHDQHNAEDQLTLDQLNDTYDNQDCGDDIKDCCVHVALSTRLAHIQYCIKPITGTE